MAKKRVRTNHADVTAFLNKVRNTVESEVRGTTNAVGKQVADAVYQRSQQYVPKDTGALAASGKVIKTATGKYSVKYDAPYAYYVHENLRTNEPFDNRNGAAQFGAIGNAKSYTTPGTGPKYLERAVDEEANEGQMIKYVRDALGRFRSKITLKG